MTAKIFVLTLFQEPESAKIISAVAEIISTVAEIISAVAEIYLTVYTITFFYLLCNFLSFISILLYISSSILLAKFVNIFCFVLFYI